MKISKKLENLYVKDCLTNERELNYQLGFRGIEIKFTNKEDWTSEFEGEEYLICFEKFLNTCENLDFYIYDGSSSVICNIAEMAVVVNDEDLETFNNLYKYFKKNYEEIIDGFRLEAEEIEKNMSDDEKLDKTAVGLRKEVLNNRIRIIKIMKFFGQDTSEKERDLFFNNIIFEMGNMWADWQFDRGDFIRLNITITAEPENK